MARRGSILVGTLTFDFSGTTVTSGAWVQMSASLPKTCNHAEIIMGGNTPVYLGYGGAGGEVTERTLSPNSSGSFLVPLRLDAGMRVALKAVSSSCTGGTLLMNLFY